MTKTIYHDDHSQCDREPAAELSAEEQAVAARIRKQAGNDRPKCAKGWRKFANQVILPVSL